MEVYWLVIVSVLCILLLEVVNAIMSDTIVTPYLESVYSGTEGFANMEADSKAEDESKGISRFLGNTELYDKFYAGIYDQLTQGTRRTHEEVSVIFRVWTKRG
jgi:hypothetical protein